MPTPVLPKISSTTHSSFGSIDYNLVRPRLLALLEQCPLDSLSILAAPSGSGKTTLLKHYQRSRKQATCWLTLKAHDANASRFYSGLTRTLKSCFPMFEGFVVSPSSYDSAEANPPFVDVFKEALTRLKEPVTIIIDAAEHLVGAPWLNSLADLMSSQNKVRWILATKNTELLVELRSVLAQPPQVIHAKLLNFNGDEIDQFIEQAFPLPISGQSRQIIQQQNLGHPATLKLIQLAMTVGPDTLPNECLSLLEHGDSLHEELAHTVLIHLPTQVRELMVNTAFLERFNDELCEFLLDKPSCSSELQFLEKTNFLIERCEDQFLYYRFHPAIRALLLQSYNQQPAEHNDRLISRACTWLTEHNHREDVLSIAISHSQQAFYYELVRQNFTFWLKSGNVEALACAIQNDQHKHLLSLSEVKIAWLWVLTLSGQLSLVYDSLREMDPELCNSNTAEPINELQANILVLLVLVEVMRDQVSADNIERLKKLYNHTSTHRELRICIDNLLAYHETNDRRFRRAREYAQRAQGLAEQTKNEFGLAISIYVQARLNYFKNDLHNANLICDQYLQRSTMAHGLGGRSLVEAVKANLLFIGNKPEAAEAITSRVIGDMRVGFNNEIQIALFLPSIRKKIKLKQFQLAGGLLNCLNSAAVASGSESLLAHISFERCRLASIMGDVAGLADLHDNLLTPERLDYLLNCDNPVNWNTREKWLYCHILYLVSTGELLQAKSIAKHLLYQNIEQGFPVRYLTISMTLGWLEFELGNKIMAFKSLNNVLLQADASGIIHGLFDDIPHIENLINSAIQNNAIEQPRFLSTLIDAGYSCALI